VSDIPGLPSAIGIEAVECVADSPSGMTVRVTGRWRRRRPEWHGPAMLVVEAGERRHRVPAMPEPPSLTGTLPGTWRMSFSVPEELIEYLSGRTWLQLGAVMAPLSLAEVVHAAQRRTPAESVPPRPPVDPELLAERQKLGYEFAAQSARRRAEEAEARAAELQNEIGRLLDERAAARREPEALRAEVAERERQVLALRQRLHAEEDERGEAQERLAEREHDLERLRDRARQLSEREHELERELRRAHRAVDEAQHQAAVARAELARARATQAPREPVTEPGPAATEIRTPPPPPGPADAVRLIAETRLMAHAHRARRRQSPATRAPTPPTAAHELEQDLLARERASPQEALRRERAAAAELIEREREVARAMLEREREAARVALEQATRAGDDAEVRVLKSARENLARDLASLRLELSREREARRRAEERVAALEADLAAQRQRSARALQAIVEFRQELQELRAAPAPEPTDATEPEEAPVQPARLEAALERLREQHPPAEPPPAASERAAPSTPQLTPAAQRATDAIPRLFSQLVREDPAAAGRLVLQLLPAQPLVHPRPLAYDLVLAPATTVRVTSAAPPPQIELDGAPRPSDQTQFRVDGSPAALARLIAAGPLRRRLTRRAARLYGDARSFRALRALVQTPISLQRLIATGAELEPLLALRAIALMIDPRATVAERFSIAHRPALDAAPTATLHIRDGAPPAVSQPTLGQLGPEATLTLVCSPGALLPALLGARPPGTETLGDERPLGLLAHWLESA
jgi:hypothetical protein